MVPSMPKDASQYFSYFAKLSVFLKNRKGQKLSETLGETFKTLTIILGFADEGIFRADDTWLEPGIF
jgi:hypothetical protein